MSPASTVNSTKAARQPLPALTCCTTGAMNSVPKEPAAETMPSTRLRRPSDTARAEALMAMADAQQERARPIMRPRPRVSAQVPWAEAESAMPPGEEQRAADGDGPHAPAIGDGADEGLADAPHDVLHGDRERYVGREQPEVLRDAAHEQPGRLSHAHREREHDGGAEQDGQGAGLGRCGHAGQSGLGRLWVQGGSGSGMLPIPHPSPLPGGEGDRAPSRGVEPALLSRVGCSIRLPGVAG